MAISISFETSTAKLSVFRLTLLLEVNKFILFLKGGTDFFADDNEMMLKNSFKKTEKLPTSLNKSSKDNVNDPEVSESFFRKFFW